MILFHKPTDVEVSDFLSGQRSLDVTYAPVGATSGTPPVGFVVDHHRARLGHGENLFHAAKSELAKWTPFDLGWMTARPAGVALEAGETIAVIIHRFGLHWMNACRVVAVIDEESPRRFGFTYGTLPGHAECGEERFLLEMDEEGVVWFDILAFSRPRHWLAKLGYPIVRRLQKSFAPAAAKRLRKSIS